MKSSTVLCLLLIVGPRPPLMAAEHIVDHEIRSPYQREGTQVRVLLPSKIVPTRQYPVVYLLPVEARAGSRFGDGLLEAQRADLHNQYQMIFVMPTFSAMPWYADHPSDATLRQESHFTNVVVPFVEQHYPVIRSPDGRYLLGFSKSGWGAWSLLLRHPNVFGRALAWDAPLMTEEVGAWGSGAIFGTQENFERYRLTTLVQSRGPALGTEARLFISGYGLFRQHQKPMHALLVKMNIPHGYRVSPKRQHNWHSGWLPGAVATLVADRKTRT